MREMRSLAALIAAVVLIHLALIQPNHPQATTWGAFAVFPLELPAILVALALAHGGWSRALRVALTATLGVMVAVKAADFAGNATLGRAVNPVLDGHLAVSGWRLLSGAVGTPLAFAAALSLAALLALVLVALWRATGRIAALAPPPVARRALVVLLVPTIVLAGLDAAREVRSFDPPGAAFTTRLGWDHLRDAARARADIATFRAETGHDATADLAPDAILPDLRGRDVLLVFIESYGRVALEHPLYAPTIRATLAELEPRLVAQGLAMRSGYLTAPIVGGQSWLAHASLLSGLRIDSEGRYRALTASPRRTLLHLAQTAGWRSVAVMPAITLGWAEAAWFGYDRVLAAHDLGYAGPRFNWVTMPDQFTLAAFERAELGLLPRAPVFAEIALISSHAPWTPIPPLLPWENLGDGRVFETHARAGPAPDDLWRDPDLVREQFRQALDYSLRAIGGFAQRRAGDPPLMIVLGDHPPAPFVSLGAGGRDVPIHAIGPPALVARFADWGWTEGLVPGPDVGAREMAAFRDLFLTSFGSGARARCAALAGVGALPAPFGC